MDRILSLNLICEVHYAANSSLAIIMFLQVHFEPEIYFELVKGCLNLLYYYTRRYFWSLNMTIWMTCWANRPLLPLYMSI